MVNVPAHKQTDPSKMPGQIRGVVSDNAKKLSDVIDRVKSYGERESEYERGYKAGVVHAFKKIHKLLDAAGVKVDE